MNKTILKVENLSKQYRLGQINTGTLSQDLNRWWYNFRGKQDPYSKIGVSNDIGKTGDGNFIWSLKNIDFELKEGEVLGIIGNNGAGKSTLLKILSEVTAPTTGKIKIRGRIGALLEVGTGFHPDLTGRENIFLNGAILGMTKLEIKKKFDEIVDFSGVEKYIDTPVKRYSTGMTLRLGFAVAAHLEPEILIVDEVLAVGDAEFQKKCLGKMKDVSGQGRTILFVSHNMAAIQNLCSKSLYLKRGVLTHIGDSLETINIYLNETIKLSKTNLQNRTDRKGNKELRVTNIYMNDKHGNNANSILNGDLVEFNFELENLSHKTLEGVKFAIGIDNMNDQRIVHMDNELINKPIDLNPGKSTIRCVMKKMNFISGEYFINTFCSVKGEIYDWINKAYSFQVEEGDYYDTGKRLSSAAGCFYVDFDIDLK